MKSVLSLFLYFFLILELVAQRPFDFFSSNVATNDAGVSAGVAIGDYNNDNYPDIFVCNIGQNNFLYRNNGDGTFTKIKQGSIVSDGGRSSGAVWGDVDNDGDLDLFVANQRNENNFLYKNNGDGTFEKVTEGSLVNDFGDSYSANWIDYNLDGYIDLYVANTRKQNDFIYLNKGNGIFERVFNTGLGNDLATNWGVSCSDIDNDGDIDVFIPVRDGGEDQVYINNGAGIYNLIDIPIFSKRKTDSNSVSFADFDNDDDQDLFIANGTNQENELFINHGHLNFSKASNDLIKFDRNNSGIGAWGDFNNDGYLDLFVMNYGEFDALYLNQKGKKFVKESNAFLVNIGGFGSGLALFDLENDGDLDLFIANWENQNNKLYKNNTTSTNWLKVKCIGVSSNFNGLGAKVIISYKTKYGKQINQFREIISDLGRRSQSDYTQHFGLEDNHNVDQIIVEWPSGKKDLIENVTSNQTIVIKEGTGLFKSILGKPVNKSENLLSSLAKSYNKADKPVDKVFKELEKFRNQGVLDLHLGINIARYMEQKNSIDGAIQILSFIINIYPNSAEAYLWRGRFLKSAKNMDAAKRDFLTASKTIEQIDLKNETLSNQISYELKEIKYLEEFSFRKN